MGHDDLPIFGYEAWRVPGTTTTGQAAWCVTWLLTEPIKRLANPPPPRDPTTSRSASREALTSSSATSPVTALTVSSGTVTPISRATLFCELLNRRLREL